MGLTVERYDDVDYGRPTVTDGAGVPPAAPARGNLYMFGGRRYDPGINYYHDRSRYLDPHAGRYLTRGSATGYGGAIYMQNSCTYEGPAVREIRSRLRDAMPLRRGPTGSQKPEPVW